MKHTRILAIAAAAALATACTDSLNGTDSQGDRTGAGTAIRAIHASSTRTDFNGEATSWVEGDAMSVIIAGEGQTPQAYRFTVDDPANGIFTNNEVTLDPASTYDIYAVYPYNADKGAVGYDDARFDIGAAAQTQQGSSAAHVAQFDPLTGSAVQAKAADASLTMYHTATVLQLRLRNATAAPITGIKSVTVTAPDGTILAAPHAIDLADGSVEPDAGKASNTIVLTVESSGEIPADGVFPCWMAAAPFIIDIGEGLDIEVATDDGTIYRITKEFASSKSFPAGTIMSTDIELSSATQAPESITLDIDFTQASTYPQGFPTKDNPASGDSELTFAGHKFRLLLPGRYYYGGSYLAIENITKNNPADIVLPLIKGYAPRQINVTVDDSCKGRNYTISVTDTSGTILPGTEDSKTATITEHLFSTEVTGDSSEYRIHIYFGALNNATKFPLSALNITYARI